MRKQRHKDTDILDSGQGRTSLRLNYLDNLKSAALLFGIIVHSDNFVAASDGLPLVKELSTNFRMATFYLVAGFFAAMVLSKRGVPVFLRQRTMAVGIPLLLGLLLLNPLTIALEDNYRTYLAARHGIEMSLPAVSLLLHLWFLVCLLIYVLVTPLLVDILKSDRVSGWIKTIASPRTASIACFAITLVVTFYCLAVQAATHRLELDHTTRSVFFYAPFFVMGLALFVHEALEKVFYRVDLPTLAFGALLIVPMYLVPQGETVWNISRYGGKAALSCGLTFALLWAFRRFVNVSTPLLASLSRSIYTMYLLHYLLLTLLAMVWVRFLPTGQVQAAVSACVVAGLGWLIHAMLVERVPVLALLLNGKYTARKGSRRNSAAGSLTR